VVKGIRAVPGKVGTGFFVWNRQKNKELEQFRVSVKV